MEEAGPKCAHHVIYSASTRKQLKDEASADLSRKRWSKGSTLEV